MTPKRCGLALIIVTVVATPSRAETWPSLDMYVKWCALIVKCKTEVGKGYRVVETWKGTYSPDLFFHRPPDGYVLTNNWHGNEGVADGREIVFFFTMPDHSTKLDAHSTAFHVNDGRVVYASTGGFGMRQEFTIEAFGRTIRSIVRRDVLAVRTAFPAVGGVLAASGPLPAVPEEELAEPVPVTASVPEPAKPSADEPAGFPTIWLWVGLGGLMVGILLVVLGRSGKRARA